MATSAFVVSALNAWIDGAFRPADVRVEDGIITDITERRRFHPGHCTIVPGDAVLLPGLVDSHVHVNEPGRTDWEGFDSATLAAAAGGVTTIVDMPLNSIPPTTTTEALDTKRAAAAHQAHIDVGFWGGAIPDSLGHLGELYDAGVYGFKAFLSPSGVDEFPHLCPEQLRQAMAEVAAIDAPLIVHAEDPALLHDHGALGRDYDDFLASRPAASEESAIAEVIAAAREAGARAHILHLSDAGALPLIRQAKADGVRLTVETCPHYLTFTAEEIPDGAAEFKCCPPIREASNRDRLWEGIVDGTIDAIVSDHSPSTVELKRAGDGDFGLAWGGISGLQVGLSAVWTEARKRGIPLETIIPLFTTGPVRVAGLSDAGRIAVGAPAHLTVFGLDDRLDIDSRTLRHRNPISAYDGRVLTGAVRRTWLRGSVVYDITEGRAGEAPHRRATGGHLLSRNDARDKEDERP